MFLPFLAAASLCLAPASFGSGPRQSSPVGAVFSDDSLAALYSGGRTWQEFLDAARARRMLWVDNYESGRPDDQLVARARAVHGTWRFLVVAVDSCSDSANTIPYLARLVELVPGLELRIVAPSDGRWVMEAYRTEDGRPATPTVLLLDEAFREQGCFVERPVALRRMLSEGGLGKQQRYERKMEWYRQDGGTQTIRDLVALLEGAAAGTPICEARR